MIHHIFLKQIADTNSEEFRYLWRIYEHAFPSEERRTLSQHQTVLQSEHFHFMQISYQGNAVGFITYWEFEEFCFIEHFAIDASCRGGGLGGACLAFFIQTHQKPIILEVELPHDEQQQRRIHFYRQYGFCLNEHSYIQPPYQPGGFGVEMKIMSYPNPWSKEDVDNFISRYHPIVYSNSSECQP